MSTISQVESNSYSYIASAAQTVGTQSKSASFADYLKETEDSASSSSVAQTSITSLLGGNSYSAVVGVKETDADSDDTASSQSAQDEFLDFMSMSTEERIFVSMLNKKGYTKEEYDALPDEEKLKIQQEIEDEIKQRTEQKAEAGEIGEPTISETAAEQNSGIAMTSAHVAASAYKTGDNRRTDWV